MLAVKKMHEKIETIKAKIKGKVSDDLFYLLQEIIEKV